MIVIPLRSLILSALFRIVLLAALLLAVHSAHAQTSPAASNPLPIKITLGLTFQLLRPAEMRRTITIQNNNTTGTDNCFLLIGGPWVAGDTTAGSRTINGVSVTGQQGAIILAPGAIYTRREGYIPSDQLLATCVTTGNSVYVDIQ